MEDDMMTGSLRPAALAMGLFVGSLVLICGGYAYARQPLIETDDRGVTVERHSVLPDGSVLHQDRQGRTTGRTIESGGEVKRLDPNGRVQRQDLPPPPRQPQPYGAPR